MDKYFKDNNELLADLYNNFIDKKLYNFNIFNDRNDSDLFEDFIYSAMNIDKTVFTSSQIQTLFIDYKIIIDIITNIYNTIYNLLLNKKNSDEFKDNYYAFENLINNIKTIQISSDETSIINKTINLRIQDITDNFRILLKLFNNDLTDNLIFKQKYAVDYPPVKYSDDFINNNDGILNNKTNLNNYNMTVNGHINYGLGLYKIYYSSSDYDDDGPIKLFNCRENQLIGAKFTNNIYDSTGYYKSSSSRNNYIINSNYEGEWIVINLPMYVSLSGYYIVRENDVPNNAPSIFRVYGSSDGINWDIIDDNIIPAVYINNKYTKIFNKETILYNYVCFTFSQIFNNNVNGCLQFIQLKLLGKELEINEISDLNVYKLTFNKENLVIDNEKYDITNFNETKKKFFTNNLYNILNSNSYDIIIYLYYYKFLYRIIQCQNDIFILMLLNSDDDNINSVLISLNLLLTTIISSNNNDVNRNNTTIKTDYMKTIDDTNNITKKYNKLKPKSNLNIINYNNNNNLINNVKIISYIIIILLIIISILSIYIISQKTEFNKKINNLGILLLICIIILFGLYYYKNNNIIENFETANDMTNNLTLYINNIKQLIFMMNKQILQLTIYDTNDLLYINENIKDYNNNINTKKLNNLEKTNSDINNNNNIINIDYDNYFNLNILFCYLTCLLIFTIIILMYFDNYYYIIIYFIIIFIIIIILFFNYYYNNKENTRLKSNRKYWNNNFTDNY